MQYYSYRFFILKSWLSIYWLSLQGSIGRLEVQGAIKVKNFLYGSPQVNVILNDNVIVQRNSKIKCECSHSMHTYTICLYNVYSAHRPFNYWKVYACYAFLLGFFLILFFSKIKDHVSFSDRKFSSVCRHLLLSWSFHFLF